MTRKDLAKMISAVLIFVVIFGILTMVMEPKWNYYGNQAQTRVQAFYRQEKNSDDVLYLGASYSYCDISPLKIWEEQGITGYVFSNPAQKAWISAYYLEEALKYQTPKVVMFEAGTILDEEEADEGHNRKNIDYLRWSPTKLRAILTICKNTGESKKEYLLPLLRFHSRWSDLDQTDFHLGWDSSYYLMGTALKAKIMPPAREEIAEYEAWEQKGEDGGTRVGPKCRDAVLRMKELCGEKGIRFQLIRMPSMKWSPQNSAAVQKFADENGIPYLDMNLYQKEIGIDWETDTHDKGEHLNILGCGKASSFLGKYLKENYTFDTKLSEENRRFWDGSAEKFDFLTDFCRLQTIDDCAEYVKMAGKDEFITAVVVRKTVGEYFTDEQRAEFGKLGLSIPEADSGDGTTYFALLDGGKVISEVMQAEGVKSEPYAWNSDTFRIVPDEKDGSILRVAAGEKEFAMKKPGIHMVMYSKTIGQVADVVRFDTTKPGIPAKHKKQLIQDDGGE